MTADEARKLVDKAEKQPKIDKHLYKEAISEIKEAAKDGQYSCGFRLWGSKIKTEAIKSCVEFAERNHCSVRTEINDIPMLISYGSYFTEHPGMPYSIQDCTDFFVNVYKKYTEQKEK